MFYLRKAIPENSAQPSGREETSEIRGNDAPRASSPELITYEEAIQQFGRENPNASANIIAFYGKRIDLPSTRAKL